jgi:hypothetical protein
MLLSLTILSLVSVAFYLIRVGGRLRDAKLSDEAIRDIKKVYKLESQENRAVVGRLDGSSNDPDSIASLFPDELHPVSQQSGDSKGIRQTSTPKD